MLPKGNDVLPPTGRGTMYAFSFESAVFRWKTYFVAAGVIFLYGVFNVIFFRRSDQDVSYEAMVLGALVILLRWGYLALVPAQGTTWRIPRPYQIAAALMSVVTLGVFLLVSTHYFPFTTNGVAIQDSLGTAVYDIKAGKIQPATKAARKAKTLLASAKQNATPLDAKFFVNVSQDLSNLRKHGGNLGEEAFDLQLQLAEYRSELQSIDLSHYVVLTCSPGSDQEWFAPNPGLVLDGQAIVNCKQHIDKIKWYHVVFVNAHIIYQGGPLFLNDVTFVNCTFSVEKGDSGFKLLQYVALARISHQR
jgi:hypothetical protein